MISCWSAAGATLMLTVSYQSYQIFFANGKEREILLPKLSDRKIIWTTKNLAGRYRSGYKGLATKQIQQPTR
jgi:hypothetical protein